MDVEEMDDRKAAQSMDFEQFHALRNRRRNKPKATSEAGESVPAEKAAESVELAVEPVKFSETVGEFVEMHEVQVIVILLIVADILAVALELYIELGALGASTATQRLSSLLDAFTGFTIFFFLIEIGLTFFAFGEAALLHAGYVLDTSVVLLALYWEVNMQSKTLRLLSIVRVWRAMRLVNGMVTNANAERDKVAEKLRETELALSAMELDKERTEQALRREAEAKHRMEKQVQGYKDMNETLHEALSIAAHNAAEHQLTADDGEAFIKGLEGDAAGDERKSEEEEDGVDGGAKGAQPNATAARHFQVMADGSFKEKT